MIELKLSHNNDQYLVRSSASIVLTIRAAKHLFINKVELHNNHRNSKPRKRIRRKRNQLLKLYKLKVNIILRGEKFNNAQES